MSIRKLPYKEVVELRPMPPFSFAGTVHKPSNFPTSDREHAANEYWQSLFWQGDYYGIKMIDLGTVDNPKISLEIFSKSKHDLSLVTDAITQEIQFRFDLESGYSEFVKSLIADPVIGSTIRKWQGMRVSSPYSLYEFLVVTVVLQNTTVRRSVQMMSNLFERFGNIVQFDGHDLTTFWSPKTIDSVTEDELRDLKLGYRAKTLKRQAKEFADQKLDEQEFRMLSAADLKKKLLHIYGVGPASVQYLMFEKFHHYDACERIPPWEQKIYSRLLFEKDDVNEQQLLDEIETRWGKWKMLAMHYLFENLFWLRKTQKIDWLEAVILL